jgi:hypothetical protein
MRYCELAGLTGVLNLSRPPQAVTLAYERGALAEVRVGGAGGIEFQEVFGWEDGRFSVEAHHSKASVAEPPTTRTPRLADAADAEDAKDANDANDARDTDKGSERAVRSTTQDLGGQTEATFLRVVEMSLEDLLRERVERTPSARTGPVIPELPAVRPTQRPSVSTPLGSSSEPPRGESTVRVIYLAAERSPGDEDRRPAMDLNVPLPGEGTRAPSKPELPRNTAISALDDAGRLRQSKWPEAAARSSRDRDDEATTKFDTASHAALDLGRLPMMLAATEYLENAPMTESTPRPAESPKSSAKPGGDSSAQGVAPADASPLTTLKWVAFACLVLVACLGVLARLPGID